MGFSLFSDLLLILILLTALLGPTRARPFPGKQAYILRSKPKGNVGEKKKKYMEALYFLPGEIHVGTLKVLFTPEGCS